ncbi:MAG: hypothetical protein AB8B97_08170 [Granulosicoccus sp.]
MGTIFHYLHAPRFTLLTKSLWVVVCLLFGMPVLAQTTACAPGNTMPQITSSTILTGDSVVAPWSNETPVGLRSSETIDGRLALRADLVDWAPIAFDTYQDVPVGNFDVLEFRIRSSIDNPPISLIASTDAVCALNQFVSLQRERWVLVQVPLASLGLIDQPDIGRLKIKSAVSEPFTLWVTDVKLISTNADNTPPPVIPEPVAAGQCIARPLVSRFLPWHIDPGVIGEIDDHLPVNVVRLELDEQDQRGDINSSRIEAALDTITGGGVLEIPAGTFNIARSIRLRHDYQVVRGAGSDQTQLIFTESLNYGIGIFGADNGIETTIAEAEYGSTRILVEPYEGSAIGRYGVILNPSSVHMQTVSIVGERSVGNKTELLLSDPMNSDFDSGAPIEMFDANEHSGIESLSLNVGSATTYVGDMVYMQVTAHAWLRDVESRRAEQAHVFTRQTYACEITGNTILDATRFGDGKQGYGIDLANSTTGCLIENNTLAYLRHAILLNIGASGNVVAFNYSYEPRHPNFLTGGPADISFHHFTYANLVEGNVVERIHVGDSNEVGGGNLVHRNCLTAGPLTVGQSPNAVQTFYTNVMYGSNAELQSKFMPYVEPMPTDGRFYLEPGTQIFDDDGITVEANTLEPTLANNWFAGEQRDITVETPDSYYGSSFSPLVKQAPTGNWMADCTIPAYLNAQGLVR